MTPTASAATFSGLVDLAAAELGGRVLGASDEFFAEAANLLQPGRASFVAGKFTDRGKWMDGWESRRKRAAGHDWCVLALGAPGQVVGFDIDTQHFVGNHPPFASVDGIWADVNNPGTLGGFPDPPATTPLGEAQLRQRDLPGTLGGFPDPPATTPLGEAQLRQRVAAMLGARDDWAPLLDQAPLRPDAQNLFAAAPGGAVTHVRLNIFPDGGVARFRVFGRVHPRWDPPAELDAESRPHVGPELRDLAAVKNGGLALACSDAFFGPMNNLLLPGRPADMGGGWETRRRRGPGHDWILLRLGARGVPAVVEVDTAHFKGNFPERCSIEALDVPSVARITDLLDAGAWRPLLPESPLRADARHFFPVAGPAATHLRLNVFPDGGVARLRVWGRVGTHG